MPTQSLRTVQDRFSLVDLHRHHTAQNGRKYMLQAVDRTINSQETQERIKLGEAFGYYGHGRRELNYKNTGSIKLQETSVIMVEGQPIIVDNVPSNRTLDIRLNMADGIVTHTQELLDTPTGQIVDGMEKSLAGGWSWATKGGTQGGQSIIREYAGMDYVKNPNFISLDRLVMMNESAEDEEAAVVASLMTHGMSEAKAQSIYQHYRRMHEGVALFESAQRATDLELELFAMQGRLLEKQDALQAQSLMLESVSTAKATRKVAIEQMLTNLPYHVTDAQKAAMINQETPEDIQIFTAFFESVARSTINNLPIGRAPVATVPVRAARHDDPGSLEIVNKAGYSRLQNRHNR
jgi:hypothetical protein